MRLMVVLILSIIPFFSYAEEAKETVSNEVKVEDSQASKENTPPTTLSEEEKKVVDQILEHRSKLSESVQNELKNYELHRNDKNKRKAIYSKFSQEAKKALKEEYALKKHLNKESKSAVSKAIVASYHEHKAQETTN